ncbi:hypothetical protein EDD85DRAFT_807680 [Armillaria nabsnona]|nr:hypothetical protein EDD85DRAFT_807680 [Armillaria nabsnona]
MPSPSAPEHLNNTGFRIQYSEGKGRGIYASRFITKRTLVEIRDTVPFQPRLCDYGDDYGFDDYNRFHNRGIIAYSDPPLMPNRGV